MDKILKNLRIRADHHYLLINPPEWFLEGFSQQYPYQPSNQDYDFAMVFAKSAKELTELLETVHVKLVYDAVFWVCYPKLSGTLKSDLKREVIFNAAAEVGMKTVTQIALDATWSAMRIRPQNAVSN